MGDISGKMCDGCSTVHEQLDISIQKVCELGRSNSELRNQLADAYKATGNWYDTAQALKRENDYIRSKLASQSVPETPSPEQNTQKTCGNCDLYENGACFLNPPTMVPSVITDGHYVYTEIRPTVNSLEKPCGSWRKKL